jgi:hypothetical protein
MKCKYSIISIIFLLVISISFTDCKSEKQFKSNITSECDINQSLALKSPLTYQKFISIINSNEIMSDFKIDYVENDSGVIKILSISAGLTTKRIYFSSIESFYGRYSKDDTTVSPMTNLSSSVYFNQQEIQELLDYISLNHEYFFNAEEYEGLTIPYESEPYIRVCKDNFIFALGSCEPGSATNIWAITKCMSERPQEGHPLYGLIQIIERDFISKFEE